MAELTPEEAEAVVEALPKFIEGMTKLRLGFIALGSALVGATAGFVVAEKRLRGKYEALSETEISSMREHFHQKLMAQEGKPALDGLVKDLGYTAVDDKSAEGPTPSEPGAPNTTVEPEPESRNVFQEAEDRLQEIDPDEGWNYDIEKANRSPKAPYVIHRDEQGEMGLTEATWTYYEGDDVVCDSGDKIIDERDVILGDDFVEKFGHGSDDPNVVYIRNEQYSAEIELCRSPNSYAEEVHGFKHSDEVEYRTPRRYSIDDA